MPGDQVPWTYQRVSQLEALWAKGATADAIASQLDVSRAAVLGKIYRLRRVDESAGQSKEKQGNTTPERARQAAQSEIPIASLSDSSSPTSPARRRRDKRRSSPARLDEAAKGQRKSLLQLTNESCRWPCGNPGSARFHFCGAPANLERGRPYCLLHTERAYSKQIRRRS